MVLFQIFCHHSVLTIILVKHVRTTETKTASILLCHSHRSSAKYLVRQQGKRLLLNAKLFPSEYLFKNTKQRKKFSSGPYSKIRTAQETNHNAPFHHGPFQPHNKNKYLDCQTLYLQPHSSAHLL